jgi:hypothetical protein
MSTLTRCSKLLAATAVATALLSGCTAMKREEADQVEKTLAAAGFQMKLADTPAKLAKLQELPVRKITTRAHKGAPMFVYADPDFCKCLYAGTEEQYARYRQLAIQQKIAQEQVESAEMNENAAMDFGMWGPFW